MAIPSASSLRHVRPVQPLYFPTEEPESEHLGQSTRHFNLCAALYRLLRSAVGPEHTVGADQFVYFNAANPERCLAPDAFVRLGRAHSDFDSYKAWEEGTPQLAIEVLSPRDTPERWTFKEKLRRYRELGVQELVVFHVTGKPGNRLRAWDRIDHDLVERIVEAERTQALTLGLHLLLGPVLEYPCGLRIARDPEGNELIALTEELLTASEGARVQAESRVAELEAALAKVRGGTAERGQ